MRGFWFRGFGCGVSGMIIPMMKNAGGVFCPADEMYLPDLQSFKNGEIYEI